MSTCSGKAKFRYFQIILHGGISSTIIPVKLMSKLKEKNPATTTWENKSGKFTTSKMENFDFLCDKNCDMEMSRV